MLTVAIYRATGRILRFIAHGNLFFTIPVLRTLAPIWGLIPNRHVELADAALHQEGALMLYPGSGTEAILRRYRREPYVLKWDGKLGFVELAARHRATVLFVAGVGIDELYYQTDFPMPANMVRYANAGDAEYYRGARLQIGAAGCTAARRPAAAGARHPRHLAAAPRSIPISTPTIAPPWRARSRPVGRVAGVPRRGGARARLGPGRPRLSRRDGLAAMDRRLSDADARGRDAEEILLGRAAAEVEDVVAVRHLQPVEVAAHRHAGERLGDQLHERVLVVHQIVERREGVDARRRDQLEEGVMIVVGGIAVARAAEDSRRGPTARPSTSGS